MPEGSPESASEDRNLESWLVQLTRDLVLIESTQSRPDERRRCFQLVRNHLDELPEITLKMYEKNGYESLVALPEGVELPDILFCGHLDVVEHLNPEAYRSYLSRGCIHGAGTGDMKGALAILIILVGQLWRKHPQLPVGLAITSDEEQGGENGTRYLVEEVGLRCGSVILPDGGSIDRITVEEKGILHLKAVACGYSAHAARPWAVENSLQHLIDKLHALNQRFQELATERTTEGRTGNHDHWYPTCSVTRVSTPNESINRIPEEAVAILDVRFPPPWTVESMHKIIAKVMGEGIALHEIISTEPTQLDPDPLFIQATEDVLGHPPRLARIPGGSDARFFRPFGIPVIQSRPITGNLHRQDEWIEIRSMLDYFRICETYVSKRLII